MMLCFTGTRAHPLDVGYLVVREKAEVLEVTLEINPEMAKIGDTSVAENKERLLKGTLLNASVTNGTEDCPWSDGNVVTTSSQQINISAKIKCPTVHPINLKLNLVFLKKLPSTFQLFVRTELEGSDTTLFVADKAAPIQITRSDRKGFATFLYMGMQHIGVTPDQWMHEGKFGLPDGIDHILFIVALILACMNFTNILFAATGFTIGHSLTLALGAYDLVHLPQKLVESAIALSIAWMGVEALLQRKRKRLWIETSLFGLVHGLGLASALQELQLFGSTKVKALLGFNVGVEFGQIAVVIVVLPILLGLSRWPKISLAVVRAAACLVSICGLFWMVTRLAA